MEAYLGYRQCLLNDSGMRSANFYQSEHCTDDEGNTVLGNDAWLEDVISWLAKMLLRTRFHSPWDYFMIHFFRHALFMTSIPVVLCWEECCMVWCFCCDTSLGPGFIPLSSVSYWRFKRQTTPALCRYEVRMFVICSEIELRLSGWMQVSADHRLPDLYTPTTLACGTLLK